ncbi:hypothetical protein G9A89_008982 [Geosiphon pyriformis]|nr:hypothetical protein G9A89_008982 [Geosiphon pyriformis]
MKKTRFISFCLFIGRTGINKKGSYLLGTLNNYPTLITLCPTNLQIRQSSLTRRLNIPSPLQKPNLSKLLAIFPVIPTKIEKNQKSMKRAPSSTTKNARGTGTKPKRASKAAAEPFEEVTFDSDENKRLNLANSKRSAKNLTNLGFDEERGSDKEDVSTSITTQKRGKKATTTKKPATTRVTKKAATTAKSRKTAKKEAVSTLEEESNELLDEDNEPKLTFGGEDTVYDENKTIEEIYQKKTQLEHILLRPDTYIGSVEAITLPLWVLDKETNLLVNRDVKIVPGLYKIVDEILVNAADNKARDKSMTMIKVNIDRVQNSISVFNNGRGIPIEIHKEEKIYVPELIFGHLLTSSNYDDNQKKVTGGRNGYGAKLANIFSKEFIVETADKNKIYKQVFRKNMSVVEEPEIRSNKFGEEFTKITFKPDLEKFGMEEIDDDLESLLKKRAYDMAGITENVKVYLNDHQIKIKNFKEYVQLYIDSKKPAEDDSPKPAIIYDVPHPRWEISLTPSTDGQFQQVSFVNSICTAKGGTHVDYIEKQITSKLLEAVKKKTKADIKPHVVKSHIWLFINCKIENPAFDSQTKENMTLRSNGFGSVCEITDSFIKKVLHSGVVEAITEFIKFKQDQQLKRTDGAKKSRIHGIPKLEDANNAGTKNGKKCTLILTEGDSAKSLAVAGLQIVGRDNYGVFPLRGKLLNVREASHSQILNNAEISNIKKILGLQTKKQYTSIDSLRYGSLMIMTDQDHDGSHIKGLIINFLDHFFPSLMKISGFLVEFITPIVKVTRRDNVLSFFTIPEYERWKEENDDGKGWTIKYYKGLGTSTDADAKKYFRDLKRHRKPFRPVEEYERDLIDMAFSKKKADARKQWLSEFQPGTYIDHSVNEITIDDFVNRELILFSMADNVRSIPSVVDGLKPGQRKVIYSCIKRNLKKEIKVAQLAGYISEHSAYHHGEASLTQTIIGLAHDFVGSNNINLLTPSGSFGTRAQGGKDAASARYLHTEPHPLLRRVFIPEDDNLLTYLTDDGLSIEPEWYIPILPMVLVNGSEGIGTGWRSSIPNYNPRDMIQNIRRLMTGREVEKMHPWYRGFKGDIESIDEERYKISGNIRKVDYNTIEITELPIRVWTQNYKETLESWVTGGDKVSSWIKDYKDNSGHATVSFLITLTDENMKQAEAEGLEHKFKTSTSISTSNMVCFDAQGRLRKYASPEAILCEFYELRLRYYHERKKYLIAALTEEWKRLNNKSRFVRMLINEELQIKNKKNAIVVSLLEENRFEKFYKKSVRKRLNASENDNDNDNEDEDEDVKDNEGITPNEGGYEYLLSMPINSMTYEKAHKLDKERDEAAAKRAELEARSAKDLWNEDLDRFLVEWDKMLQHENYKTKEIQITNGGRCVNLSKGASLRIKKNGTTRTEDTQQDNFPSDSLSSGEIPSLESNSNKNSQKRKSEDDMSKPSSPETSVKKRRQAPKTITKKMDDMEIDDVPVSSKTSGGKGKQKAVEVKKPVSRSSKKTIIIDDSSDFGNESEETVPTNVAPRTLRQRKNVKKFYAEDSEDFEIDSTDNDDDDEYQG